MRGRLTRAELLASGASTIVLALLPAGAQAATPSAPPGVLPAADLAYARLLICFELLAIDFYENALRARHLDGPATAQVRAALANERAHYAYLADAITTAGGTPLTATDVNFSYPAATFYTARSLKRLALELETLTLGAYVGAGGAVVTPALASALAQITANEAQHQSVFARLDGQPPFDAPFPPILTIEEASNALSRYTS
ncbi:MAG: ferritin-like domain-containing protein [Solirubrobacteraceae bacterium]